MPLRYALPLVLGLYLIGLAGCIGTPIKMPFAHDATASAAVAPAPAPVVHTIVKQVCIPLRPWTQKDLDEVAEKLAAEPKGSIWWTVEQDWIRMRDDTRACIKANR